MTIQRSCARLMIATKRDLCHAEVNLADRYEAGPWNAAQAVRDLHPDQPTARCSVRRIEQQPAGARAAAPGGAHSRLHTAVQPYAACLFRIPRYGSRDDRTGEAAQALAERMEDRRY